MAKHTFVGLLKPESGRLDGKLRITSVQPLKPSTTNSAPESSDPDEFAHPEDGDSVKLGSGLEDTNIGALHAAIGDMEKSWGQTLVDNLNRNTEAEFQRDLAAIPPKIRATKTEAEWAKLGALEMLHAAPQAKSTR